MIVTRRPFTIYDVDLAFAAGLVIIAVLGFVILFRPALARHAALASTRAQLTALQAEVESRRGEIGQLETDIAALQAGVTQRAADIPVAGASDAAILALTDAAQQLGVTFDQIVRHDLRPSDGRFIRDVQFEASAEANEVIRWLDLCAREHPYVAFVHLQVRQLAKGNGCSLSGRMRLHLLPDDVHQIPVTADTEP